MRGEERRREGEDEEGWRNTRLDTREERPLTKDAPRFISASRRGRRFHVGQSKGQGPRSASPEPVSRSIPPHDKCVVGRRSTQTLRTPWNTCQKQSGAGTPSAFA